MSPADSVTPDWEQLPGDPDPVADLGYHLLELEVILTDSDGDRVIILPKDESLLKEDAFIVAREGDVEDLARWI